MTDYYKILNVDKNATATEIRKAYRFKALEFHPDKNKSINAKEKFIEIYEAYKVLSDSILRRKYDNLIQEHWDQVRNETSWNWTNDKINNKSKKAREQGTKYAENYDLFSRKVLENNFTFLFLGLFGLVLGEFSLDALWLVSVVIGIVCIHNSAIWLGVIFILLGVYLLIKRWRTLAKEFYEKE